MQIRLLLIILLLDIIWILYNNKIYKKLIVDVQKSEININYLAGAIAYIFIYLIIIHYSLPLINNNEGILFMKCIKYSGFLGLYTYAILNFTNLAIFKDYNSRTAIKDTIWGGCLFTLASYLFIISN